MAADELLASPVAVLWDGEAGSKIATRCKHALRWGHIATVGELTARDEAGLLRLGNFGTGCLAEARRVLAARGLALSGGGGGRATADGGRLRDARGLPYEVIADGGCVVIAADAGLRLGLREREEFEQAYKQALAEVPGGE